MDVVKNVKENKFCCHDCRKKIKVADNEIKNGTLLVYNNNGDKIKVLKCNVCFKKNPSLNNFQGCEVYSRVVGYLRPVSQWNVGKQEEYRGRMEYKV